MESIINKSPILEGLDGSQKDAVCHTDGPVLIVAGAGSGKTRVLTSRIAWLLEKGCEPDKILALTFTRKAASEMKERIAAMVGDRKARRLYMGTFHSVFIRFLREYADRLGYSPSFTIYDTGDSMNVIKACLKAMELDEKVYKPKDVLSRISNAKSALVTPEMYRNNPDLISQDAKLKRPEIAKIYSRYAAICKQTGVMDFDDILLNMNILLRDVPEALASVAGRFSYILVDEYQDTNFSQYIILRKLAQQHRNICVVGDDSQSIYGFRGATISNILNFKRDYPGARIFRLEHNYRSTKNIVGAANSVIEKNKGRIPKNCFSTGEEGDKIRIIKAYTDQEEARLVASSIVRRLGTDHCQYKDFAILYRANSQSRSIEEALRKSNLPYMVYSGNSFFDRMEVKDMMAYFKLAVNPNDDESFKRVLNKPARGIGATSESALVELAAKTGGSLYSICQESVLLSAGLRSKTVANIMAFKNMIAQANLDVQTKVASEVAEYLVERSGILASYRADNSFENQTRASNVEELLKSVVSFVDDRRNELREEMLAEGDYSDVEDIGDADVPQVTLGDFLENMSLLSVADVAQGGEDTDNKITLMTVHSSKGLEFPYVYIIGMEDGMFPVAKKDMISDIEEERRLFYVAITRAEKVACLSYATTVMLYGKSEPKSPSQFLREIDPVYLENPILNDDYSGDSAFGGFGSRFAGGGYSSGEQRRGGRFENESVPGTVRPMPRKNLKPVASVSKSPGAMRPMSSVQSGTAGSKEFGTVSVLDLKVGQKVEHNLFGYGVIKALLDSGGGLKAKIDFVSSGEKTLLLSYAKLRIVD